MMFLEWGLMFDDSQFDLLLYNQNYLFFGIFIMLRLQEFELFIYDKWYIK